MSEVFTDLCANGFPHDVERDNLFYYSNSLHCSHGAYGSQYIIEKGAGENGLRTGEIFQHLKNFFFKFAKLF